MSRRRRALAAIVGIAAATAALTLVPMRFPGGEPTGVVRLGLPSTADLLRNLALFAPLGAALALGGLRLRGALAAALAFASALELAQLFVAGRYAAPSDVAANGLGAALGAWAAGALARLGPAASLARAGMLGALGAGCTLLATALLAAPTLPEGRYFAHWVPALAHFAPYSGRLERATLDGRSLAHGPLPDSAGVRGQLAQPYRLSLRLVPAEPPAALAALFMLSDDRDREVLLVGLERDDVVLHFRDRATALGLETLALSADRALAEARPGVPIELEIARAGERATLRLGRGPPVTLGNTLGRGWALVAPSLPRSAAGRAALDAAWTAALWLLPGLGLAGALRARFSAAGLALLMATLPALSPLLPTPASEWLAAAAGLATGWALGRRLRQGSS